MIRPIYSNGLAAYILWQLDISDRYGSSHRQCTLVVYAGSAPGERMSRKEMHFRDLVTTISTAGDAFEPTVFK